ncbi:hypothetical protein OKA05_13580 [Luteolibacter arcticus]|uniref:Uncharacterized protein n=1 Tax=Luteolibacter arcticus TaxID=1581411 RepID=A0ABT3GJ86_9BACT|nr:hypothetical protein [Luteolibacter arcticus]MCW1923590.1 hypothetical protein [Luteolibacter arcticus]
MKARLPVTLIGTHLLALGAGWWFLGHDDPEAAPDPALSLATKSERAPRQDRRVSTADLLAAYNNHELLSEVMKRRNEAAPPPPSPPHGTPSVYVPAAQRAAEIADMAAAMQKELDAVDAGKMYDHELARALVARWMKEDPAACAAWIGQMKMRVGWGDPFDAFAKTLPPRELIALMDRGWIQRNRSMALRDLAEHVGDAYAADLTAVLALLGEKETKPFLEGALGKARVEDAAVWLTQFSGDTVVLQSFASRWIDAPDSDWRWEGGVRPSFSGEEEDWQEKAKLALDAVAGTPAEEIFQRRWEEEQRQVEKGRELARVAHEPAEATAALVELYLKQGNSEAEARQLVMREISQSYQNGMEVWQGEAWEQDLQLSLLGQRKFKEVLTGRLDAIAANVPEILQSETRSRTWNDAMPIDPAAALEVARQTGQMEEVLQSATKLVRNNGTSLALQAQVLLALAGQGLWQQDGKQLPSAATFSADYLRDDPEAARQWIARLPSPLSQSVKEETR